MSRPPPTSPPVQTIPMRDVDSVLIAWEVIEVTCARRTLRAAVVRGLDGIDGTWEKALDAAQPFLDEVKRKCSSYRNSVDRLLVARGLPAAPGLEEAQVIARTRPAGDQLVCHVAMSTAYAGLQSLISLAHATTQGPDEFLDGLETAMEDRALELYELQKRALEQVASHCQAGGMDVSGIHPLPNPFGIGDSGPCWCLAPIGIELDW